MIISFTAVAVTVKILKKSTYYFTLSYVSDISGLRVSTP
jgi:hypothetical protein